MTKEWWENRRHAFDWFISQSVMNEIKQGHPTDSAKRLAIANSIILLDSTPEVAELALAFLQGQGIPSNVTPDAYHIATATVHQMNYLVTWNCKHIANPQSQPKLRQISLTRGYELPILCTPYELL